ncbi:Crp/Fnr family transcriptional regulator [Ligilactobacillus ceti]|uniref:HTH crp-type domain-containing protein n=1 Tax=Ligilactobacillus ceti DSM 22408 TaxID=1122146 RepID=A0A0R2KGJ3_9LACO|nr:Crp/Fnr family transcriptional regulator [Ligilactobacillus ceti]KRN88505.1 hypothetical protein IV53_GL000469 [Ligilactobacillus ceti DSM 22408]
MQGEIKIQGLTIKENELIAAGGTRCYYEKSEEIYLSESKALYYIEDGILGVKVLQKDYDYMYSFLDKTKFWPLDRLQGFSMPDNLCFKALTSTSIIKIPYLTYQILLLEHGTLAKLLLQSALDERRIHDNFKYACSCKSAQDRVLLVIFLMAYHYGQKNQKEDYLLPEFLTQQILANLAQTTPITVSKVVQNLQNDAKITFNRKVKIVKKSFMSNPQIQECLLYA